VLKQLEPMDKGRRCYRMIGDVLVERTVAETLPAGEQVAPFGIFVRWLGRRPVAEQLSSAAMTVQGIWRQSRCRQLCLSECTRI
jgi:hypothetical protein